MRIQDSRVVAKAARAEQAAKKAAKLATTREASEPASISTLALDSMASTQATAPPMSSGSTLASTSRPRKRSPPAPIRTESTKRAKPTPQVPHTPITPNQPTEAVDVNYTGDTVGSGGSDTTQTEDATRHLINTFIDNTLSALGPHFRMLSWSKSPHSMRIAHGYTTSNFKLGSGKPITAINDGGLEINYRHRTWYTYNSLKPWTSVLSVEVSPQ